MNWDADAAIGDDAAHDTVDGERLFDRSMTRLAAAPLLTTTTTRVVSVLGVEPWTRVEHTFSFDKLMDDIYNVVMQYYDANRNIEAFDGVTKEQGLINLLSLPGDQFNVVFNGRFDINADGFTASKNFVREYVTKVMEASIATATAPTPTEQFQMMMELMSASASNMNAVASILDAERVERIAGQVQHKAWIDQNTIGIGKAHERIDIHGQRIDILERTIEALMNASASNIDDVARTSASNIDAERVERIAGQVQHKALLTDALSELERPTKGSTSMVKGLQSRAHN